MAALLTCGTSTPCRAHRSPGEDQRVEGDTIEGRMLLIDHHEIKSGRTDDFHRVGNGGLDERAEQQLAANQAFAETGGSGIGHGESRQLK
jgi:hypothetical protein